MTNAIVLGSTGEVGRHALLAALASPAFTHVHSFGRSAPQDIDPSTPGHGKLVHTPLDFDKLHGGDAGEAGKLRAVGAGAVLVALGTTRASAGSAEAFKRIDREYVVGAVGAARVEGREQVVVYCSSAGSSATSPFLYPSSKGLTEQDLAALGYTRTVILRPGYLQVPGGRAEGRLVESIFGAAMKIPSLISSSVASPTPSVGRAMVLAALKSQDELVKLALGHAEDSNGHPVWAFSNSDILKAAKQA